jgi:hypothetical protein
LGTKNPPASGALDLVKLATALLLMLTPAVHAQTEVVVVGVHLEGLSEGEIRSVTNKLVSVVDRQRHLRAVPPSEVRARVRGRGEQVLDDALTGQGRALLAEGRMLYEQADLESAQLRLGLAVTALDSAMAGTTDSRPLIDALLLMGMAQFSMGEPDAAREVYQRVLRLDPTRELDTVHYPPKVVAMFQEVREAVLAAPRASLRIVASDPEARVFVNGRMRGRGQVDVTDLVTGSHHVLVSSDSGHRSYAHVGVKPGAMGKLTADLRRRFVGQAAPDGASRSDQVGDLYRVLGDRVTGGLVLLAGRVDAETVGVQLFEPRTGNFSKILSSPAGSDPSGALLALGKRLGTFLNDSGVLRSDQVGGTALALDISTNPVLAEVLLDSRTEALRSPHHSPISEPVAQRRRTPWYLWAGVGVLAAGATAAAVSLRGDAPSGGSGGSGGGVTTSTTGTVVVLSPR